MIIPTIKIKIFSSFMLALVSCIVLAQGTKYQYLSGTDKDNTKTWDFFINTGMRSGKWNKIEVPSNWEQQGFGTYNYYKDTVHPEETGLYRCNFMVEKDDLDKEVFIVFEASMTDTEVKINGQLAGAVHQGGFYTFQYNITDFLKFGKRNLLEVRVRKRSTNESINKAEREADFWLFGGIFRPVYLKIVPKSHIERIAINADASGKLNMDVYANNLLPSMGITAQVEQINGNNVGRLMKTETTVSRGKSSLHGQFNNISQWNPESPILYQMIVSLIDDKGKTIHQVKKKFGFRTAELRPNDGFYVNGKKVIFKGVNRHSQWPESGRTLSKMLNIADVKLMKEMNMNAVRMSHYPPDPSFLDACDSLGLFVINELTGWQSKYDTEVGKKLVKELVIRDVNHPSVIIWANGNEGGWNTDLDDEFQKYDPQNRLVIHPWETFNGTDTKHYPDFNYVQNSVLYGKEVFFPTEFMHGLQDGGQAAGLSDFWHLMLKHPFGAGGFLWSFADEGIARTDQNGKIDIAGNAAPDGVLGPHREKEASFFAIREIWSPIVIDMKSIPEMFDGSIAVTNRYLYTNLDSCSFNWVLASLPGVSDKSITKINSEGNATISLAPGESGHLKLNLPQNLKESDVLYLTAYGPDKQEVFTWSWPLRSVPNLPQEELKSGGNNQISTSETDSSLVVNTANIDYYFSKTTGYIQKVVNTKGEISFSNGPVVAGEEHQLKKMTHYRSGEDYVIQPEYTGKTYFVVKWTFSPGKLVQLDYQYKIDQQGDFIGITFNYPEKLIEGMRWKGRGPYRVWKNRLQGQKFGVWEKKYNNTITGESWNYPEFKGYHEDVYWVTVVNKQSPFTVYTDQKGVFFQMLKPQKATAANNDFTNPPFPKGDLGFLKAISPIGTKFQSADKMGPQSQKNMQLNYTPFTGTLWFDFK